MLFETRKFAVVTRLVTLTFVLSLAACHDNPPQPSTKVFASPEDAGQALLNAAKSGNQDNLLAIFGPQSKPVISSGDAVEDKSTAERFISEYGTMHRWRRTTDGGQTLVVGADNFAFPIPLKKNADGQWFFDTDAGKQEILARRIGRNELAVIDVCEGLADAQTQYFSENHNGAGAKQYAAKFISDPGRQNGLFWQSGAGQPRSPLGPMVASATNEGYSAKSGSAAPFHGYNFKMLTAQGAHAHGGAKNYVENAKMVGGFGFVAYPAQYGNSGIMTFIVNQDGIVYQKDLGSATARTAAAMVEFDPGDGWIPVT
jgi:hypothetical protein